jgi:hypothetical protein
VGRLRIRADGRNGFVLGRSHADECRHEPGGSFSKEKGPERGLKKH